MLSTHETVRRQLAPSTDLRELADGLLNNFSGDAAGQKVAIVNEIPSKLSLKTDPQMFSSVLGGLLLAVMSTSKDSCIRLTAKTYRDVILMQIRDSNNLDTGRIEMEVQKLHAIAEQFKGSVGVTSQRKKVTTITFGFPNLAVSAWAAVQ